MAWIPPHTPLSLSFLPSSQRQSLTELANLSSVNLSWHWFATVCHFGKLSSPIPHRIP
ncbi:hypothetical protein HanRHA438_Chr09g0410731 [Helianthus annuus]|nr:hypothetical protein HanRHA438_Chr09g0410731 [Helianthus annuus]